MDELFDEQDVEEIEEITQQYSLDEELDEEIDLIFSELNSFTIEFQSTLKSRNLYFNGGQS